MRPSGIRKFFDIAAEMKDCISLGVGEPDFKTPWTVRDAGITQPGARASTWYTEQFAAWRSCGRRPANYLARRLGLVLRRPEETVVTVGGSEAIDMCIRALVNPGDEVIIPEPCFVCYVPHHLADGRRAGAAAAESGKRLSADGARSCEAAITPRTKLFIFPFPCNPTGAVMRREDLEPIAGAAAG